MNIWFDDTKMQRILNNIYSNAFKFTPDGGLISTIVATEKKDERIFVRIEISDTGCGISEKDLNVIFDRFYQSEPIPGVTGSGIGLHMVKEYVSLHNGKIEVHSKIGVGTTFLIYIPSDLKGDDSEPKAPAMFSDVEEKVVHSDRKTILIVEDNVEFRRFLVEQLTGQFNILEAGDGAEGEESCHT